MANEVATKEKYPVLEQKIEELREVISANMGTAGGVSQFDLDRVKVPAGGSLSWTVPTLEGDQSTKDLDGIVVAWRDTRAYWADKYGGGTSPPQCSSADGIHGVGDPGGNCMDCPLSQWGSAEGNGQACKAIRLVFLLRPESLMPLVLPLPPTSIQNAKKFFLRLASSAIPFYGVITRWRLEKASNASGIAYAKATPTLVSKLAPEDVSKIRAYAETLKASFERVKVEESDYENGNGSLEPLRFRIRGLAKAKPKKELPKDWENLPEQSLFELEAWLKEE